MGQGKTHEQKRTKTDVLVIYGGRSAEHEISCRSARFILKNLDPAKYAVHALAITKDGSWLTQDVAKLLLAPSGPLPIERSGPAQKMGDFGIDAEHLVVFPILHGSFGEDGTMQGLLEMKEVAFVGPDTLGSAIGMDKIVSKKLAAAAGVPVVPWRDFRSEGFAARAGEICAEAVQALGLPLFVKPARLGSSVGVTKVKTAGDLRAACEQALSFDDRVLIETGLDVREIEVAALGGYDPAMSVPGEVIPHAEFYSYDAKYTDAAGASMAIPAKLTLAETKAAQDLAHRVFVALDLYGMARVDLFLEKGTGAFYFNEVNTIPGFTEISQYPLLWKESGVSSGELLDRLIANAAARQQTKTSLRRSR